MDKIAKKIIGLILAISFIIITFGMNKAEAASSFSITSGISTITVGNSYTISVSAEGLTGRFNITHSSNVSVNVSSIWVENGTPDSTIRVTTKSTGKATVTLTPETVANSNGTDLSLSAKTDTVTVKAKTSSSSSNDDNDETERSNTTTEKKEEKTKPTFREVNETVYATESGINVRSSYSTSSSSVGSLNKGDELTRIGEATSAVDGITWSRVTFNGQTAYVSSAYLTTEEPEESANKTLKSLTIDGDYTLTPEFDPDVTEYTLNVPEDVTSLDIDASLMDENAKVEITGNDEILDGVNTVEIKVTAEDGTARTYTINVTKGEFSNIGLKELSIDGYTLTPEFSANVYEYTLEINDLTITSLNVNAIPDEENATVEIVGNTELKPGENIITILVKSEDNNEIATYQIFVNIVEKQEEQLIPGINNKDLFLYGGIALAVIVILIIILVVRHRRKLRYEDEEEPYYGGFDSLNRDVKDNFSDTQEFNDVINNKNVPETTESDSKEEQEDSDPVKKHRKSVIEENFGADIKNDDFDNNKGGKKKGKHF